MTYKLTPENQGTSNFDYTGGAGVTTGVISAPFGVADGVFALSSNKALITFLRVTIPPNCVSAVFEIYDNAARVGVPVMYTREFGVGDPTITNRQLLLSVATPYQDADETQQVYWRCRLKNGPDGAFTVETKGINL